VGYGWPGAPPISVTAESEKQCTAPCRDLLVLRRCICAPLENADEIGGRSVSWVHSFAGRFVADTAGRPSIGLESAGAGFATSVFQCGGGLPAGVVFGGDHLEPATAHPRAQRRGGDLHGIVESPPRHDGAAEAMIVRSPTRRCSSRLARSGFAAGTAGPLAWCWEMRWWDCTAPSPGPSRTREGGASRGRCGGS
jgi:hypothetical protein